MDFGGFWWAAVPRENWPDAPTFQQELEQKWDSGVGDCRQELVFIGIGMDEIAIYDSLQACLLTDEEYAEGIGSWQSFSDPFPRWELTVEEALAASE